MLIHEISKNVRLLERLTVLPSDVPTVPGSPEQLLLQGLFQALDLQELVLLCVHEVQFNVRGTELCLQRSCRLAAAQG